MKRLILLPIALLVFVGCLATVEVSNPMYPPPDAHPQQATANNPNVPAELGTYYWCIGQWAWVLVDSDGDPYPHWEAPHRSIIVGLFDMRGLTAAGQPGGIPEGSGLFVYSEDPQDGTLTCKADSPEDGTTTLNQSEKNVLKARLGMTGSIKADTICGYMLESIVEHGDQIGTSPLEPMPSGAYGLWIGSLRCEQFQPFS